MESIVIIGSSGHAKVVIDIVRREGRYRIAGLLDRFRVRDEETLGCRVLGAEEDLPELVRRHDLAGVLVAIGDNFVRERVAGVIRGLCPGLPFVSAIHPGACVASDAVIGDGTVIMAGVAINPSCMVGDFCILNTHSSLDHDSRLEDYASLAPAVTTGGRCRVGHGSAVSIGAVLLNGVRIGEHSVVGAGALVLHDVAPLTVVYGSPAKVIRSRKPGDPYL